jgi:hypothetical protein
VSTTRLRVAGDPALALVVRIFVGSVTELWAVPEPIRDDLRLAASELFSGAVEAGVGDLVTFELSDDEGAIELRADEMPVEMEEPERGALDHGDERRGHDVAGSTGRSALIRALFPDADVGGSTVRIRVRNTA